MSPDSASRTSRWRLAGFDLDGTLIPASSTLLHLGAKLGRREMVAELAAAYDDFSMDNVEVSTAAATLFVGRTRAEMQSLLTDLPHLKDIRQTIQKLHHLSIRCVIATVTFDFSSQWFAEHYGFDSYSGVQLEHDRSGRYTGRVVRHFTEEDKVEYVRAQCSEIGVSMEEVFYMGDSRSDIETFRNVGYSVALNGSPLAVAAADRSVHTDSLADAIDAVPDLQHQRGTDTE